MTTDRFKAAFTKGIAASEEADANLHEAEQAIRSFGESIHDATGGALAVYLDTTYIEKSRYLADMVATTMGQPERKRSQTHGIFAQVQVGDTTGSSERLCIVTFAPKTYPIEVQWANDARICSTRDSLLDALEALMSDPGTGKKLRKLLAEHEKLAARLKEEQAKQAPDGASAPKGEDDKS